MTVRRRQATKIDGDHGQWIPVPDVPEALGPEELEIARARYGARLHPGTGRETWKQDLRAIAACDPSEAKRSTAIEQLIANTLRWLETGVYSGEKFRTVVGFPLARFGGEEEDLRRHLEDGLEQLAEIAGRLGYRLSDSGITRVGSK